MLLGIVCVTGRFDADASCRQQTQSWGSMLSNCINTAAVVYSEGCEGVAMQTECQVKVKSKHLAIGGSTSGAGGASLYAAVSLQCLASMEACSHRSVTIVLPHCCPTLHTAMHLSDRLHFYSAGDSPCKCSLAYV